MAALLAFGGRPSLAVAGTGVLESTGAALLAFGGRPGLVVAGTGVLESTGSVGNTKSPVVSQLI